MKNIFYFIIALMLLVGCADIKEEHGEYSVNESNQTNEISQTGYSFQTIPNKYSIEIPDNVNFNSRSSYRNLSTNSDFVNIALKKYSQILIEEDRYLFSKDFEITKGYIQKNECTDKNEESITIEVSDMNNLLDRMINFIKNNKFSDEQVSSKINEYESLKGFSLTSNINPTIYQNLSNDNLYDHIVMTNYEENMSFCSDNMTYNDQVVWKNNNDEERLAGFGVNTEYVNGLYYDKILKTGSYFYVGKNEKDYLGNDITWNRMIQKSGHFSSCGNNCVIFQSSGFFDNVTIYELEGAFDSSIGGYVSYKISSNGNVSEREEYWDANKNIISESNSLIDKSGKFFNLNHTLDLSNLTGSNKVWLLFNTNTLPSNGRLNWWNVEGVVASDSNSNLFSSLVRVSNSAGSKTLYAHEISSILAPDNTSNISVIVNSN